MSGVSVMLKVASDVELTLFQQYGGLLDSAMAARILGYPSAEALTKARLRGALALQMMRIPHRRGWWTTPKDVAFYLASLHSPTVAPEAKKGSGSSKKKEANQSVRRREGGCS